MNCNRKVLKFKMNLLAGGERSGFDARSCQPGMTLGIIAHKQQKNIGDDWSTLTLKLMGRVIETETEDTSGPTKWTSVQQKL